MSLKFFAFLSLAILVSFTVALPYHRANFATTLGKSGYFEGKPFYKYFNFTKATINRWFKNSAKTNAQKKKWLEALVSGRNRYLFYWIAYFENHSWKWHISLKTRVKALFCARLVSHNCANNSAKNLGKSWLGTFLTLTEFIAEDFTHDSCFFLFVYQGNCKEYFKWFCPVLRQWVEKPQVTLRSTYPDPALLFL